ncbi:glycosyltransferase [Collinsella tanakaei]|nr:glycosyltransferase [Collinsella tanakaei]
MPNKPRVLITGISPQYGGTEMVVSRYVEKLSNRFAFDTLSYKPLEQPAFYYSDNRVVEMPARRKKPFAYYRRIREFFESEANGYCALWHNASSFSNITALKCAYETGIPVRICHFHSAQVMGKLSNKILHEIHKYDINKLATVKLACSTEAGTFAFGNAPFRIIRNAFSVSEFHYSEWDRNKYRAEFGLEDALVIGNVGRLCKEKNQIFLIDLLPRILSRVPNAILVVAGDGVLRDKLKEHAARIGVADKVRLLGARSDVDRMLSAFDIFAFPSLTEGLGVAVIEAQANGLPCIISDSVPASAVVSSSTETLSLDDSDSWVDCICNCPRYRVQPDQALLERYDIDQVVDCLASILSGKAVMHCNE